MKTPRRAFFLTLLLSCAATAPSFAQTTWTGGGTDSNWSTAANWDNGVPVAHENVFFGASSQTNPVNDLLDPDLNEIGFNVGASSYTLTIPGGAGFVATEVDGGGIVNNSSVTQTINVVGTSGNNSHLVVAAGPTTGMTIVAGGTGSDGTGNFTVESVGTVNNSTITANAFGVLTFINSVSVVNSTINVNGGLAVFDDTASFSGGTLNVSSDPTSEALFFTSSNGGDVAVNNSNLVSLTLTNVGQSFSFGSIAGAGVYNLGSAHVTVGSLNTSTTVTGALNDSGTTGGASLTKVGTGTLTLMGQNTYTGATTVSAGALMINGSTAASSAVSVANGATLGGSGTINGSVHVASGGTLSPSNGVGAATLNTGDLTFDLGSQATFNLSTPGSSDVVVVNGDLDLGGATLNINSGSGFGEGIYTLFAYSGLDSGSLAFGDMPTGFDYSFLDTGSDLDLVVTAAAVPEPQSWAMLAVGLVVLGVAVRRSRVSPVNL